MELNPGFLLQQCLMLCVSGAATLLLVLLSRPLRSTPVRRSILELLVGIAALYLLGFHGRQIGFHSWLASFGGRAIPHFVTVALVFYWVSVWWPVLVWWRRRTLQGNAGRTLKLLAACSVAVASWATLIEPDWLDVDHREIQLEDIGDRPIKVAHISDLQLIGYGLREQKLVDAVQQFAPDIIIMTGDYMTSSISEDVGIHAVRKVLMGLHAPFGIYATTSDSDTEPQRLRMFAGLPITYLLNRSTVVDIEGTRVRIGGLNHFAPRYSRVRKDAKHDEVFLIGCHPPDLAEITKEHIPEADLYLSGHTHGGQLQIPFYGPPLTFSSVPRHVAAGGIFETSNGMPFTVTRGVGMEGNFAPRFRLNCRPHVFLLTLVQRPR